MTEKLLTKQVMVISTYFLGKKITSISIESEQVLSLILAIVPVIFSLLRYVTSESTLSTETITNNPDKTAQEKEKMLLDKMKVIHTSR